MGKQVIVTLTRVYKREVEREIPAELIKGMTDEEIQTFLMEEWSDSFDEDDVFEDVELEEIGFREDSLDEADTDRFDRQNEFNRKVVQGDFEGAHDALDDVKALAKCFFGLLDADALPMQCK